ncbi:MAG: glycosyltransferase family 2 protein [Thalassobaculaceae bacterium]|nr:glycosyltransferase family 2 protein [Thalassobaculaceae bacterium]
MSDTQSQNLPALSVIVPVCDEAGAIAPLLQEVLDKVGAAYRVEVIVVDDGSRDGTDDIVADLGSKDPRVTLIRHAARSGKSAALRTGARAATALWMATIDGDGENDPADVVAMASAIDATSVGKVGLVAGIRRRRTAGIRRLIASRIGNGVRRALLRDDCPDTACGLKVVPRALFLAFPYFDSLHRYLPALTRRYGYETVHVSVDDRPRAAGQSKYTNIGRALVGIVDLLGVVWLLRRTTVGVNPIPQADRAP